MEALPLRVVFARPGFFVADTRLEVLLDGQSLYAGSFLAGVDVRTAVLPGPHTLRVQLQVVATIRRSRAYAFTVSAPLGVSYRENELPALEARLVYSRLWGNFARTLDVHESGRLLAGWSA